MFIMIDFRLDTFLNLCDCLSYTRTARLLHMTQPAVTQHIQHLQQVYGCSLFTYKNKKLELTPQGHVLREHVRLLKAQAEKIPPALQRAQASTVPVVFGATLTIGEYTMPPVLLQLISDFPDVHFSMVVGMQQVFPSPLPRQS